MMRVSIRNIPDELWARVRECARAEDRNINTFVIRALEMATILPASNFIPEIWEHVAFIDADSSGAERAKRKLE